MLADTECDLHRAKFNNCLPLPHRHAQPQHGEPGDHVHEELDCLYEELDHVHGELDQAHEELDDGHADDDMVRGGYCLKQVNCQGYFL